MKGQPRGQGADRKPDTGPRWPGSIWGPIKPVVPKARKASSITPVELKPPADTPPVRVKQTHSSLSKISRFRTEESGFELTPEGQVSYEKLIAATPELDLRVIAQVEERIPGDREKLITVLESLALGARHKESLADVGWVWSDFSIYRSKFPIINKVYQGCARLGEETRKVLRLDEAHRRATEGVEEPIYSPSGKFCGTKLKYSDALLTMFLKADHPDKFTERHEVTSTGVVLNMQMGLRENVRQTAMTQSDIVVESPFEEQKEDLPGGV